MNYGEIYGTIKNEFSNSIETQDINLKNKLINIFESWFHKTYEEKLKKIVIENDNQSFDKILLEIQKVCSYPDYKKLKIIYTDESFDKMKEISSKIFDLVNQFASGSKLNFDDNLYSQFIYQIEQLESTISEVFKDEFLVEKSECLLDLEYLKNHGNVQAYSIRSSRIVNL